MPKRAAAVYRDESSDLSPSPSPVKPTKKKKAPAAVYQQRIATRPFPPATGGLGAVGRQPSGKKKRNGLRFFCGVIMRRVAGYRRQKASDVLGYRFWLICVWTKCMSTCCIWYHWHRMGLFFSRNLFCNNRAKMTMMNRLVYRVLPLRMLRRRSKMGKVVLAFFGTPPPYEVLRAHTPG